MHVEALSERILFLKGDVEMKIVGQIKKIKDPKAMLKCAADMEDESARNITSGQMPVPRMLIQPQKKYLKI